MFNGQWGQSSQITNRLLYNDYNNGLYVFPFYLFFFFVYEVDILHVMMPFQPALNVFGRFAPGLFYLFFYLFFNLIAVNWYHQCFIFNSMSDAFRHGYYWNHCIVCSWKSGWSVGRGRTLRGNERKKFLITTQDTCVTVLTSGSSRPRHLDALDTPFFYHHPWYLYCWLWILCSNLGWLAE